MIFPIWLSLALSFLLLLLFPFVFSEVMIVGLTKLRLEPETAVWIVIAVLLGGLVNIPVSRVAREERVLVHSLAAFGFFDFWPEIKRVRRETIVAVNVGGCLIPTGLAAYELYYLSVAAPSALWPAAAASLIAIVACYLTARPTPRVGIVIPGLIPAFVAAASALILAPDQAPPVAFIAGVAGPLIGADLLNLKAILQDVPRLETALISIGGAGTFDGIVLSGITAAYLA
jgi:uncharacterized membrane protein